MSISDADKQDAIDGYVHYSRVLDLDDLKEFYRDLDFTDLINVRHVLADADLTDEEQAIVEQADQRLREAFDEETLRRYVDYDMGRLPLREWWG
jgi:hypothetical protein